MASLRARPGLALLNVLIFTFLTTMFLVVGIQFTQSAIRSGRNVKADNQVYNVALAGINHAVFWLQKQDDTPEHFDPSANQSLPDEDPETMVSQEQLGLVHEFLVDSSQGVWGRYEVGRSQDAPARDGLATGPVSDLYASGVTWTAEDVSYKRGSETRGTIWRVRSQGHLFERDSESAPFVVPSIGSGSRGASIILEAEIRKSQFNFPAAALYSFSSNSGEQIKLDSGGSGHTVFEVSSGAKHIWSYVPSSQITCNNCSNVSFLPSGWDGLVGCSDPNVRAEFVDPDLDDQMMKIFGTSNLESLKGLADHVLTARNELPDPIPASQFIYINPGGNRGNLTFDNGYQLNGSGILFVDGSLKFDSDTENAWEGAIFVTGELEMKKFVTVTGTVIVGGKVKEIKGDSSKPAKIVYSRSALDRVNARAGGYRLDKSTLRVVEPASGPVKY